MRLRTLLLTGVLATMIVVVFLRSWWLFTSFDRTLAEFAALGQADDRLERTLGQVDREVGRLAAGYATYLASGDTLLRAEADAAYGELQLLLARLRYLETEDRSLQPLVDEFEVSLERWQEEEEAYLERRRTESLPADGLQTALTAGRRRSDSMFGLVDALHRRLEARRAEGTTVFEDLRLDFLRQTVMSASAVLVVLLLLYLVTQRLVEVPLARLADAARSLQRGRAVQVPIEGVEETRELGRIIGTLATSLKQDRERDARYRDLVLALSQPVDLEATAAIAMETVRRSYGAVAASLWVVESGHEALRLLGSTGLDAHHLAAAGPAIATQACASRQIIRMNDLDDTSAYVVRSMIGAVLPRRLIAAPLVHQDHCIGVIELLLGSGPSVADAEMELLVERIAHALHLARAAETAVALRQRSRLATLATALAHPLLFADENGIIQLSNRAAENLGDLVGHPIGDVLRRIAWTTSEGTDPPAQEGIETVLRDKNTLFNLARRLTDRHGELRWVRASAIPVLDGERLEGVVLSLHDVTAEYTLRAGLERANEELVASNESLRVREAELRDQSTALEGSRVALASQNVELARASRTKSEFVATMSHELRTPLNAISGFTEALLAGSFGPLALEQVGALRDVDRAGRQLLLLINDIMDLSRVESGVLAIALENVDLSAPVKEAVDLTAGVAAERGISVINRLAPEELVAHADRDRIRQVVLNLLSNALKFTPGGGRVTITGHTLGEEVEVAVADTGIGIAREDQERLFQPFSQIGSELTTRYPGTGLGLAISRRLVDAMGGRITCESQRGSGATFRFTLPRAEGAPTAVPGAPEHETDRKPGLAARVLLVDDSDVNRRVLASMLRPEGCVLLEAESGEEAVRLAKLEGPAIVLMDLRMPGMGGLAATAALKADPATAGVPVIAVTAHASEEDAERARVAGCFGYLAKPVARARLLTEMDRAFGSGAWRGR